MILKEACARSWHFVVFFLKKTLPMLLVSLLFSFVVSSSDLLPTPFRHWKWVGVTSILVFLYFWIFWYTTLIVASLSRFLSYVILPFLVLIQVFMAQAAARYGTRAAELAVSIVNTTWEEACAYVTFHNVIQLVSLVLFLYILVYVVRCCSTWQSFTKRTITAIAFICTSVSLGAFFLLVVYKALVPNRFEDPDGWMLAFGGYHPMAQLTDAVEGLKDYYSFPALKDPALEKSSLRGGDLPEVVILYIGESFRADHSPFNGYKRNTLPNISTLNNIINMPNVYSKGTQTIVAIRSLLSITHENSNMPQYKSFLNILEKYGFRSFLLVGANTQGMWYQSPHISRVLDNKARLYSRPENAEEYYEAIKKLTRDSSPCFLLLEDGAGHIPYNAENNTFGSQENIDKYDNCIIDIDKRVSSVIKAVEEKDALLIFISDHGESFGEEGRFCHSGPLSATEQTHVSAFIWYSDKYKQKRADVIQNLCDNSERKISHSFVFHTVISLCGIRSAVQQRKYDLSAAACK